MRSELEEERRIKRSHKDNSLQRERRVLSKALCPAVTEPQVAVRATRIRYQGGLLRRADEHRSNIANREKEVRRRQQHLLIMATLTFVT